jgi:hypothetical protein
MSDLGYEMGMEDAELGKQLSVARARDDGGHAYTIYHARVFSTLTGGEPL